MAEGFLERLRAPYRTIISCGSWNKKWAELGLQLASVLIALCLALLKVQSGRTAQGQAGTTGNRDAQHTNDTPSSSPVTLGERDKPHERIATYAPG